MKYIFTIAVLCAITGFALAQDRMFAYTYQTNVLNKGDVDLEFWHTLAFGKKGEFSPYVFGQHLDQRLEFEIGVGKNIQTAFYLNSELFTYADTSSSDLNRELKLSFSNEWKWKLSDPVANGVGFALYEELEVGGNNLEFETKLIFDKRWQKDLLAFNVVSVYEIEREVLREHHVTSVEWEHSSPVELYLGYLHFFKPQFGVGLEVRNNNEIAKEDGWMNSVVFAGPVVHVSIGKFFANISALPQLGNLHKTDSAPGNLDLNAFEKAEVRLLIGYGL